MRSGHCNRVYSCTGCAVHGCVLYSSTQRQKLRRKYPHFTSIQLQNTPYMPLKLILLWYICWCEQKIVVVLIIFYRFVRIMLLSVRWTRAYWNGPPPIRHCMGDEAKMQWHRTDGLSIKYEHLLAATFCMLIVQAWKIHLNDGPVQANHTYYSFSLTFCQG